MTTTLREALEEAQETIKAQEKILKGLTSPPLPYATIMAIHGETMTITTGSGMYEIRKPSFSAKVGDTITITAQTQQAVEAQKLTPFGETAVIRAVMENGLVEVEYNHTTKLVFSDGSKMEKGDKIALDKTGSVIVANLGKDRVQFNAETNDTVRWDDIGGLSEAKEALIEAVELPHKYPELYKFYHKRPTKGILLYGAPGCGKTMLGKAVATSIKLIYADSSGVSGFIYVKAPEILNMYVGNSEAAIRGLFQRASDFKHSYGYPAVIFIDEADAILGKRGTGISSDMEQTIVPMFLSEMDGLNQSDAIVLLATNRIDRLDNAVIREGRIDYKVKVTRPTKETAKAIFSIHMNNLPMVQERASLIDIGCQELFSTARPLYKIDTQKYGEITFDLRHVVSGAMIANVVDRAVVIALRRDIATGCQTGISSNDMLEAVDGVYKNNADVDYRDEVKDFTLVFKDSVLSIEKVRV